MLIAGMREIYETGTRLGIALPPGAVDIATALMDRQAADAPTSLRRDFLARRPSDFRRVEQRRTLGLNEW